MAILVGVQRTVKIMFKKFGVYTHKRMLDCNILVLKAFRIVQSGDYKVKVRWVNKNDMDLGFVETVRIKKEQLNNWYEVEGK